MDRYLHWLNTLPPLMKCLAIVGSVLGGFGAVGAVTQFMMWGQSGGDNKMSRKDLLHYLLMGPVYLVIFGIFVSIIFAIILGPFILLEYVLKWPHLLACIVGLPIGLYLLVYLLGLWLNPMLAKSKDKPNT